MTGEIMACNRRQDDSGRTSTTYYSAPSANTPIVAASPK